MARPWVAANADGRLELFAVGVDASGDQQVWHLSQTAPNGGWSSWSSLGTPVPNVGMFLPSVAANADGRLELFVTDLGGELWHVGQTAPNGEWSDWSSFGHPVSPLDSGPAVAANADGRLELFVTVQNGELYHLWQTAPNNGWSGWSSFAVPVGADVLGPT